MSSWHLHKIFLFQLSSISSIDYMEEVKYVYKEGYVQIIRDMYRDRGRKMYKSMYYKYVLELNYYPYYLPYPPYTCRGKYLGTPYFKYREQKALIAQDCLSLL